MKYDLVLNVEGKDFETVAVSTDEEMYTAIGRFTMQHFLSIDSASFLDAIKSDAPDRILAFTASKTSRLYQYNILAMGSVWINGRKRRAILAVRRNEE